VGGSVTRRLLELGAQVTLLDDLFTGLRETVPPGATFIEGSVTPGQDAVDQVRVIAGTPPRARSRPATSAWSLAVAR